MPTTLVTGFSPVLQRRPRQHVGCSSWIVKPPPAPEVRPGLPKMLPLYSVKRHRLLFGQCFKSLWNTHLHIFPSPWWLHTWFLGYVVKNLLSLPVWQMEKTVQIPCQVFIKVTERIYFWKHLPSINFHIYVCTSEVLISCPQCNLAKPHILPLLKMSYSLYSGLFTYNDMLCCIFKRSSSMGPWLCLVDWEREGCFFDSKYNLPNFTLLIEKTSNFS